MLFVTKEMLKELKLEIKGCANCNHLTIWYGIAPAEKVCLTCGKEYHLEYVEKK